MKAIDTNLLVRLIAGDHRAQRAAARAVMAAEQGASAFITFDRSLGTAEAPTRVEVTG